LNATIQPNVRVEARYGFSANGFAGLRDFRRVCERRKRLSA
jgi:hypothetical protein